ncbi:MAG: hypothetical protein ACLPV4_21230 [Solirubrobacteraceae bacterium]
MQRQIQVAFANPQNQSRATAQQQQGGTSGTIPGTSSSATQVAHAAGLIQTYPATGTSPNGDQVSGVGLQVLTNPVIVDGVSTQYPVVVMGNLNVTGGGVDCPSDFQDGGFAFVDADGNLVAGYSQETGLWGFGSASPRFFGILLPPDAPAGGFQQMTFEVLANDFTSPLGSQAPNYQWSSPPATYGSGTVYSNFANAIYTPTFSSGELDLDYEVQVFSADLSNLINLVGSVSSVASDSALSLADLDMSVLSSAGSDLSWDGSQISTAAGGVYAWTVSLQPTGTGLAP